MKISLKHVLAYAIGTHLENVHIVKGHHVKYVPASQEHQAQFVGRFTNLSSPVYFQPEQDVLIDNQGRTEFIDEDGTIIALLLFTGSTVSQRALALSMAKGDYDSERFSKKPEPVAVDDRTFMQRAADNARFLEQQLRLHGTSSPIYQAAKELSVVLPPAFEAAETSPETALGIQILQQRILDNIRQAIGPTMLEENATRITKIQDDLKELSRYRLVADPGVKRREWIEIIMNRVDNYVAAMLGKVETDPSVFRNAIQSMLVQAITEPVKITVGELHAVNGTSYVVAMQRGDLPAGSFFHDGHMDLISRDSVDEANMYAEEYAKFFGVPFTPCVPSKPRTPGTPGEYGGFIKVEVKNVVWNPAKGVWVEEASG